jgi:phospholipase/lecithinase/hemolysin
VPTCDAAKIAVITGGAITDGSSLFCNSDAVPWNGIRDGADVNTWLFADGVHPTTKGHKLLSDAILGQLKAFGWI